MIKYALNLAEDNRILSATYAKHAPKSAVLVDELPEGNIADYRYVDGEYVYDPLPEPDPVEPEITELEQLRADVDYIAMETGVEL